MPRGNDPDARREFLERYGTLNPDIPTTNAEELIRAHNASQSRAVSQASLLPVNGEATAELDLDNVGEEAGGNVIAAAVRGNAIVAVVEDETGRTYKTVVPANDKYVAPAEDPAEAAAMEQAKADIDLQAELARQRAEFDQKIAEMRAEFEEKLGETAQEKQQEASERVAEAAEEAAKQQEEAAKAETEGAASSPAEGGGAKTRRSPRKT